MAGRIEDLASSAVCQTAFGWVGFAWSQRGLVAVTLPQATQAQAFSLLPPAGEVGSTGFEPEPFADKLRRYFKGESVIFDERLDPTVGTEFQRQVWALTRAIPRGQTRTYGQIARQAGSPRAARAVGQSMGRNPWPIVVPCHRVVGHDGRLTGFGGGLQMKQRMLELEGARLAMGGW
jgi:methylated-DNA-[protein]-cysteine S-methyltransferase